MPLKPKRTYRWTVVVVLTQNRKALSLGWVFFCIFFLLPVTVFTTSRETTRTCVIFFLFFSKRRTSRQVSGAKKRTRRRDDDAQNKTINRHTKSSLFITQATLTMSIAQLGSTTAVSIHFVELDLRVARWMQGSRGCE